MIINKIHLVNFKSHLDTHIDFNTGISIIMGGNGAGKSSILEAVSFALFKQHSGKKMEQLITTGQKRMYVELEFTANGRTYRILRERSRKSSKAIMKIKEGVQFLPLVSGDRNVTIEAQGILEMDGELFLNAVYVRQGEIADLIEKTPSEKKQMIGRLLGIDSLEKAWKNMKIILDKYNSEKLRLEGKLESLTELEGELASKNQQKTQIRTEVQKLENIIQGKVIEFDLLKDKKEILDSKRRKFDEANTKMDSKKELIKQVKKTETHLNSELTLIKNKEQEIERIKPKIAKLKVLKSLKDGRDELQRLMKDEERLRKTLDDIEIFKRIMDENESFYKDYFKLNSEIADLQYAKDQFEGSRALVEQYLTRKSKIAEKIDESMQKIMGVIRKSNEILDTDFDSVEELEAYFDKIKPQLEAEIAESMEIIESVKREISNLKVKNQGLKKPIKELAKVKDLCPICKSTITSSKREELIKEYERDIETNILKSKELKVKLSEIETNKNVLDGKLSKLQLINMGILKEHIKSADDEREEIKNIDSSVEELQEKIDILEDIEKNIKAKKTILDDVKEKYEDYISARGSLESLGNSEEHLSNLEELLITISEWKNKISSLMELAGDSIENLSAEISYLEEMSKNYERLLGEVSQKESIILRMEENQKNLQEANDELHKIKIEMEDLKYNEDSHKRIIKEWELKNEELNKLSGEKQVLIGQKEQITHYIKELEEKITSYKKDQKELKNLKDYLKLLNLIRDLYGKDGVQKDLRNLSRPIIEEKTRELFEKFNFEYSDIKLDEDYDVTIYGPTGESSLDMISGGEKIAVALALRLGITQALSGGSLELIMLDEPTIHLDTYRRQELIDLLKRMSIIPQMIIVTHDTDLEDAADNILKIKKEEGVSFLAES